MKILGGRQIVPRREREASVETHADPRFVRHSDDDIP